ncbi:MAG: hypothetical protein M3Y46_06915, partial [Actinomycetota bacterium]|nr:hypothetical protein [Actinomycetota bacterium]
MSVFRRVTAAASDWIADHPMSLPGRIATLRYGRPRQPLPAIVEPPDSPTSVLIAPANYAGQAYAWCRALERADSAVAARNYALPSPFTFRADALVPPSVYHNSRRWQAAQLEAARGFTHMLAESFIPPFGRLGGRDLERQLAALGDVDIAFMCHGTDVRRPSLTQLRTRWAPFGDDHGTRRMEQIALRNLAIIERSHRRVFVSTPDLVQDVPASNWCPVVVDVDAWAAPQRESNRPLRVVHVPSKSAVKGTRHIEPVLNRISASGLVDYVPLRGVPHDRMPAVLAGADVVIDQIGLGSYGVAACEAMAAGCAVLGHVTAAVRDVVLEHTGQELPIREVDPQTLEGTLLSLA